MSAPVLADNGRVDSLKTLGRRHWPVAAILAGQAGLAAMAGAHASVSWPYSDAQSYFSQAVMLWQGLFPPDPARPLFYPYFLSLGMSLGGLSPWGLAAWQTLPFLAATVLVYRLALIVSGRRAAVIAAAAFAFFPGSVLYGSLFFYREGLQAFLLVAVLNLLEFMLRDPGRRARALYAGLAAGCLTLNKPEFGSLLAVLALFDLAAAWRGGGLRPRFAAWAVCALVAVGTTLPSVAAHRAAFHEWVFINTYKGFNYYLSYCDDGVACKGSFMECDYARYQRVHPVAIRGMFLAPASVPFGERDRKLGGMARQCVIEDPAGAASKYVSRARDALFGFLEPTGELRSGLYGQWWQPVLAGMFLLAIGLQLFALFYLPAAAPLWRSGFAGRAILISIGWYVIFYASVVYLHRFRVSLWPVLAVAAAAGWVNLPGLRLTRRWRVALYGWLLVVLLLGRWDGLSHALLELTWAELKMEPGPGLSEKERTNNLIELAAAFVDAENQAGLEEELGRFIRDRRDSLDRGILLGAGDFFARNQAAEAADFFARMAEELYGPLAPAPVSP